MSAHHDTAKGTTLGRGFSNLVLDSQQAFQAILWAMARPGTMHRLDCAIDAPAGLAPAASVVALTLVDGDTPLWLSDALKGTDAERYLRFHTGAPPAARPQEAAFAVLAEGDATPLSAFPIGEDRYPDRSATVILSVDSFENGPPIMLTGPGIPEPLIIAPFGLPENFWIEFANNHALFPCGVDVVLAAGDRIMALPRSASATQAEG